MLRLVLLLFAGVTGSLAVDYELLLEDPDVFSRCTEPQPGALHFEDLFNKDDLELDQEAEIIHISGDLTTIWDVQPTDRISARFAVMHFERGSWEPTVFSLATGDFCSVMFERDSYWFKQWTSHISNRKEIQEKCLNTRGTTLVHDPFDFRLNLENITGPTFQGRYKVVCTFEAFDEKNIPRRNSICFEMRGEVKKLKKKVH
ncbi:uncharacterized protein [Drosophila kikkawai]|uniref:Uncharacterized protein n=1 Tax=Drosophila kikkawai TaxID=30033 RepID=A0A6P4J6Q8_DROKI|nr:uncharacterized protein LOC108080716 [Drosophila kikkawai]